MISRIELENFKGVRENVALDLKPITLLFGANSSGKSTVIHALHYALEVLQHHNLDADRTRLGGESVDLGGFRNLVHGHDLDRRMSLFFEFDADSPLADYTEGISDISPTYRGPPGPNLEGAELDDRLFTAWVRLEIGWSRPLNAPQLFVYEVGANGSREHPVVRIEAGANRGQAGSLVVRTDSSVFGTALADDHTELEHLVTAAGIAVNAAQASLPVYGQESALPIWGRPLRLWLVDDAEPIQSPLIELRRLVSKFAVGIGELLIGELARMLYVGPLRTVPPRNYRPPLTDNPARWAEGLGAWDALYRQGAPFVLRVSDWLKRLGTGYGIDLRRVLAISDVLSNVPELVRYDLRAITDKAAEFIDSSLSAAADYGEVPDEDEDTSVDLRLMYRGMVPGAIRIRSDDKELLSRAVTALRGGRERYELLLVDRRNRVLVSPSDVGVGISQVLPVVVAALYRGKRGTGGFVVVEQPELHIHPKLQVELADLFIEQTDSDHCFLLETHSEHILLRLLRRIRESREASLAESAPALEGGTGGRPGGGTGGRIGGALGPDLDGGLGGRPAGDVRLPPRRGAAGRVVEGEDEMGKSVARFTSERVSVVYVQRAEDGSTQFIPLGIDETGEFRDVWPDGFFDERLKELY